MKKIRAARGPSAAAATAVAELRVVPRLVAPRPVAVHLMGAQLLAAQASLRLPALMLRAVSTAMELPAAPNRMPAMKREVARLRVKMDAAGLLPRCSSVVVLAERAE